MKQIIENIRYRITQDLNSKCLKSRNYKISVNKREMREQHNYIVLPAIPAGNFIYYHYHFKRQWKTLGMT